MIGLSPLARMMVFSSLTLGSASGCAALHPAPSVVSPIAASPIVAHEPTARVLPELDESALQDAAVLPASSECEDADVTPSDPRCPAEVVHAAAMSWLGKTTAVYDGGALEVIEYDPAEVRAEAVSDPTFRRLLAQADAAPCDGRLDGAEARVLEERVLELIDARYAAR